MMTPHVGHTTTLEFDNNDGAGDGWRIMFKAGPTLNTMTATARVRLMTMVTA